MHGADAGVSAVAVTSADAAAERQPYPGLRPFRSDESDIFFGRETQTDEMMQRLKDSRFLAVVGTSGCGKSSLVRAGLMAALETGLMGEPEGSRWKFAVMRPGGRPIYRLAVKLFEQARIADQDVPADIGLGLLNAQLRRGPLGLLETLRLHPLPAATNLLVVVDQFEEIFRFRAERDSHEAAAFVALMLASVQQRELPIYLVLTMRSDFIGECAVFDGLPEAINGSQYLTPRLSREQRRLAIVGPARAYGGDVDATLVTRLLNETGEGPEQLPVLQHLLMRMWTRRAALTPPGQPVVLTLDDYNAVGGLKDALDWHADAIFDHLADDTERMIAEVMFRRLSESPADIRRPTQAAEIATLAETTVAAVAKVAEPFRASGTNFLMPDLSEPIEPVTKIDISHESLIKRWTRLRAWSGDEAQSARIYRQLEQAAQDWRKGDADWLSGLKLRQALDWRTRRNPTAAWAQRYGGDFPLAMEYLGRSEQAARAAQEAREAERRREIWRWRRRTMFFAVLFGVSFASFLWAVATQRIASLQEARAIATQANRATDDGDSRLGILTALEAVPASDPVGDVKARPFDRDVMLRLANGSLLPAFWHTITHPLSDPAVAAVERSLYRPLGGHVVDEANLAEGDKAAVVTALAFSPIDDDLLVIATDKGSVRHCHAPTGTCSPPLPFTAPFTAPGSAGSSRLAVGEHLLGIGFSPDGRLLAGISSREQIFLWRVGAPGAAEPVRLSRPWFANDRGEAGAKRTGGAAVALGRVEPRSGLVTVATASYLTDAMIWRWDPASGRVAGRPLVLVDPARRQQPPGQRSHSVGVTSLAFSSDSRLLVTGAWDGTAKVWDVAPRLASGRSSSRLVSRIEGHQGPVRSVQFKPGDNQTVLTASSDGSSRLWRIDPEHRSASPRTAMLLEAFEGHRREVVTAVFSPEGDRVASASLDGSVRVWRVPYGEMPNILQGPVKVPGQRALVAIDRTGRLAASFSDGRTFLWPAETPIHHQALPLIPGLTTAAFDWQDRRLATVAGDKVAIWGIPMGERLRTLRIEDGPVTQVAFDPHGREFLTVSGASVRIWNANLWPDDCQDQPSRALPDQPAPVASAAYDRSGRRIITASEDGTARIWHAGRLQPLGPPLQHPAPVIAAAFAAAAGQAVTVTRDPPPGPQGPVTGSIRLWDIERNQVIDEISGLELNPGPGGPGLAVTTAANMDTIHVAVPGEGGRLPRFWLWDRTPRSSEGEAEPAALKPGPVWPANARYALWLEENGGINLFRPDASESDLARLPAPPKGDPLKAILVSPGTGTLGTISAKGIVRYLPIPSDDRMDLIDDAHLRAVLQPRLSAEERKRQGLQ